MRSIEPKGWSDMTMDKRVSIVNNLASVGLLSLDKPDTSLALVERGMRESLGSFAQVHLLKVLEVRGAESVVPELKSWEQAQFVDRIFSMSDIEAYFDTKPARSKDRSMESSGPSL